ncbi:hypothetical protein ACFE04_030248 [Oxalis oulophora]
MENVDVDVVDKPVVENIKVEENSDELKENEDDVFEEAIGTKEPVAENGVKPESVTTVNWADNGAEIIEAVGDSVSVPVEEDAHVVENDFEETSEVPTEVQNKEEVEDCNNVGGAGKGGVIIEAVGDSDSFPVEENAHVENEFQEASEVPTEVHNKEEAEDCNDVDEADKRGEIIEAVGDSDSVPVEENAHAENEFEETSDLPTEVHSKEEVEEDCNDDVGADKGGETNEAVGDSDSVPVEENAHVENEFEETRELPTELHSKEEVLEDCNDDDVAEVDKIDEGGGTDKEVVNDDGISGGKENSEEETEKRVIGEQLTGDNELIREVVSLVTEKEVVVNDQLNNGKDSVDSKSEKQVDNNKNQEIQPASDATSSSRKSANLTPPTRPAGLGGAAPLLEPVSRAVQVQHPRVNGTVSHTQTQQVEADPTSDEYDETREKLQMIRVKFLRLALRLGQTPHNVVVAQVLYRLGLAEQLRGGNGGRVGPVSYDRANAMAEQLEAAGQVPLDFSCTIMVLGKTGVGKSATINSIFDEVKFSTDAFQMGTKKVQDVVGTVQGIKVRVIDTPGLLPSWSDQRHNEKILQSVKQFVNKTPPDIVLYLDRLDMQSRDFGDMPLLRTITDTFGPSIWFNAIVVLTHAASAPPDGPNGTTPSYDMFVTHRSHVVQQAIRQAAGDMRLMNPVSLVENHSACRTNRAGQRVLPNGQVWKPHLLLLSFASKVLAEANSLLKLQDGPAGRPFTARSRSPPLPFLLSSLLQSRPQVKLPEDQFGDEGEDDLDESSDSDDDSEYNDLPPFKRLTNAQMAKLSKAQVKAYLDELEYREKLFMKKQLKDEKRQRRMMKKMAAAMAANNKELPSGNVEEEEVESGGAASSVPVPMPDLALPVSFDSDNPTHRYRYLDSSNQWLVRPVLETLGWDHDVGYEGINAERLFVVKDKIPVSFSGQITKDKKDSSVQMEVGSSIKHGEGKSTSLGFDMQSVGKDLAYTLRSETRFGNFWKNKATAGLSVTLLGDALVSGVKFEDKLVANKTFQMVMNGGAMACRGDMAYGGSLEAQLKDKDYPLERSLSTLGLSVMDWHGDLAIGCNIQSQIPIGRTTNLIARANMNNRGAGQISVRLNTCEQLQICLVALIPILRKVFGTCQQMQNGQ